MVNIKKTKKIKYTQILFVTVSMAGGGTERVIATLANYFVGNLGYSVKIMMIAGDKISYKLDEKIDIISVGGNSGGKLIPRIKRLVKMRKIIRNYTPCNIIAMGSVCGIFTALATLNLKNIHLIISERNNPDRINKREYSRWLKFIRNILYGFADKLVLQSEKSKEAFPIKLMAKATVIANPLEENLIPIYEGKKSKKIVSAGRLTDDKNFQMLIKGFELFADNHEEYSLIIYGSGELHDMLQDIIDNSRHRKRIKLLPFSKNIHNEIKDAAIYVSTSNSEGISNSIVEALALGIPVIGTDCPIGGTAMLLNDGENGYLIKMNDVAVLADCMSYIADNQDLAKKLSDNARKARDIYSVSRIGNRWIEIMS